MPVHVATDAHWQLIHPTTEWQKLPIDREKAEIRVATDLYFVKVAKD
jgi:hypothetical protein